MPRTKATPARSFGSVAAEYQRYRPSYPDLAVRAALGAAPTRVLDLGAGTGKLTAAIHNLTDLGVTALIAVEPDPQMLETLSTQLPKVRALLGSAEQIPLPDAAVDVIVVGQAMHWFDLARALPEMARVLRPGGRLAALWNNHDQSQPFTGAFVAELDKYVRPHGGATGQTDPKPPFAATSGFTDPQVELVRWSREMTAEQLHGLADTLSYVLTADSASRAALHAGIAELIARSPEPFELAELCQVWVSIRG